MKNQGEDSMDISIKQYFLRDFTQIVGLKDDIVV